MPSFYTLSSLFLLSWPLLPVSALHVGVRGERGLSHSAKRDHISGLENGRNLEYMVNITLGGQTFEIAIDTGRYPSHQRLYYVRNTHIYLSVCTSSDLWVTSTITNANDTGVQSGIFYAIGEVAGKYTCT